MKTEKVETDHKPAWLKMWESIENEVTKEKTVEMHKEEILK